VPEVNADGHFERVAAVYDALRTTDEAPVCYAIGRTGGLTVAATQTFAHRRTSTAERLRAQAEGCHYSTFSLHPAPELRAAIAVFLARLPGPEVCWVDEHLLLVAGRSRSEPRRPGQPQDRRTATRPPGPQERRTPVSERCS
jgi:hypothetical protein